MIHTQVIHPGVHGKQLADARAEGIAPHLAASQHHEYGRGAWEADCCLTPTLTQPKSLEWRVEQWGASTLERRVLQRD
jgi:hypothetical protein